uniref:T-cell surface glycoprotein CD3 gamma chain n=1 Tax=Latimeria chalumnae TaxID=7897 RepID=H3BFR3_LATCH
VSMETHVCYGSGFHDSLLCSVSTGPIEVQERGEQVVLACKGVASQNVQWKKDGEEILSNRRDNKTLGIGKAEEDPRGLYGCSDTGPSPASSHKLYVFFHMCENCVSLDPGTISGIIVGDIVATLLIAFAVYCVSAQNSIKTFRASDRQNLIQNDVNQLYQPLGDRDDSAYSHIGASRPRKK